jgi:Spy/CpxP family protein refolding chaperone
MKTILLLLSTTVLSFAGPDAWLQSGLVTPETITSLKSELDLTSEQEEKMQSIVTAARSEGEPLEQTVREQQKALNDLLRNRETTPDAASAALAKLLEAEAPVKHLQLRALIQLRDLLTLEQQRKAVKLAPGHVGKSDGIELRVKQKAGKLRAAVESLGIKPTNAMSERGAEIEAMIRAGDWKSADRAIDKLTQESNADAPVITEELDFTQFETGNVDLEVLKERYQTVQDQGQNIISIPMIRQFLKAKEAFEAAKEAQDAEKVGRILTWAEQQLDNLAAKQTN